VREGYGLKIESGLEGKTATSYVSLGANGFENNDCFVNFSF